MLSAGLRNTSFGEQYEKAVATPLKRSPSLELRTPPQTEDPSGSDTREKPIHVGILQKPNKAETKPYQIWSASNRDLWKCSQARRDLLCRKSPRGRRPGQSPCQSPVSPTARR